MREMALTSRITRGPRTPGSTLITRPSMLAPGTVRSRTGAATSWVRHWATVNPKETASSPAAPRRTVQLRQNSTIPPAQSANTA